jgi:beta-glucosidase
MFALNAKDLCSFDMEKGAWIAEQGSYKINIGASSLDIKGTIAFTLANELIVEQVSK